MDGRIRVWRWGNGRLSSKRSQGWPAIEAVVSPTFRETASPPWPLVPHLLVASIQFLWLLVQISSSASSEGTCPKQRFLAVHCELLRPWGGSPQPTACWPSPTGRSRTPQYTCVPQTFWPHRPLIIIWTLLWQSYTLNFYLPLLCGLVLSETSSQACSAVPGVSTTLLLTPQGSICPVGYRPNDCYYFPPILNVFTIQSSHFIANQACRIYSLLPKNHLLAILWGGDSQVHGPLCISENTSKAAPCR